MTREIIPIDDYLQEFGEEAIYTNPSSKQSKIKIVWGEGSANVPLGETSSVNTGLVATCKTTDVEDVDNTCRLEYVSVNYYIINFEADGDGFTVLFLSASPLSG